MKVLIIEDEMIAVRNLEQLIRDYDADIVIEEPVHTVEKALERLKLPKQPNLIFMDVQLADGLCFEIFNKIDTVIPVIFTTAYDEYAIRAFEANAVDYLMKPVNPDDFDRSMEKFHRLHQRSQSLLEAGQVNILIEEYHRRVSGIKKRFLVKSGIRYKSIPLSEIAYFLKDELTWLYCWDGSRYVMDEALSDIELLLPSDSFFRLNRQCICHIKAITEMLAHSRSRLKVKLTPEQADAIVVSHATAGKLKKWLNE